MAIEQIDLKESRPGKDFGCGCYLSAEKKQAIELAESKVKFLGGEPIVTAFEFDESILTAGKLNVLAFDSYSEDWAKFVYDNRENLSDAQRLSLCVFFPEGRACVRADTEVTAIDRRKVFFSVKAYGLNINDFQVT